MPAELRLTRLLALGLVLEVLLAGTAIWAALSMISTPDGSGMQMPVSWLRNTPFRDYFVPGLFLLLANGLLPLMVVLLALTGQRSAPLGMLLSGVLLIGWLSIQLAMIRMVHPVMHPTLYVVAIALATIGYVTWKRMTRAGLTAEGGAGA